MKAKKIPSDFSVQLTLSKEEAFRLCQLCGNVTSSDNPIYTISHDIWRLLRPMFDCDNAKFLLTQTFVASNPPDLEE